MPIVFLLTGCRLLSTSQDLALPEATLSAEWNLLTELEAVPVGESSTLSVELSNTGDLDLGVAEVALESGVDFALAYDLSEAYCEWSNDGATDWGDGGFQLHPGCTLPLRLTFAPTAPGFLHDTLTVVTVEEEGTNAPGWWADPFDPIKRIVLSGEATMGAGEVSPRSIDFGQADPGEAVTEWITIDNVGDAPLTVDTPSLSCASDFALDLSQLSDTLQPGEATAVGATFVPESTGGRQCLLEVTAEGERWQVFLQGNRSEGLNTAPSITLIQPEVGHLLSGQALTIELQMSDPDQSPESLTCYIKSTWQELGRLADCDATDETGHVTLTIDTDDLSEGIDTLEVTVIDDAEAITTATTTVAWSAEEGDDDGDGFGDDSDCDDSDSATYPGATEQWDGVDNSCDGQVDEGTEGVDDDGDAITEADGDCNDADSTVYPGAPEEADQIDNDCDGETDEGTHAVDDDGDGYSPDLGDCNDSDPEVFPDAVEVCDGIDNDCDAQVDGAECVSTDAPPVLVGGCLHDASEVAAGDRVVLGAIVDDDDVSPTILWESDAGSFTNPTGATTAWIAPSSISGETEAFTISVTVTDGSDQADWCFEEITVHADEIDTTRLAREVQGSSGGCGGGEAALLLLPLSLVPLRRRRQDP